MGYLENIRSSVDKVMWQDYRGKKEGVLVNFECGRSSELPVRDIPNESGKGAADEPNIETGTYGFVKCASPRTRNSFVKNRKGYVFFLTQYQGTIEEYRGRYFIVGYYNIKQILNVIKKFKNCYSNDYCFDCNECYALRAGESKFVAIADAFELTQEVMKGWGYKGKVSRQLKLAFDVEKTPSLLSHFASKNDATEKYLMEIERIAATISPKQELPIGEETVVEENEKQADREQGAEKSEGAG